MPISAIIMMTVAIILLWGGLAVAIISLGQQPKTPDQAPEVTSSPPHRSM